jgi:hypothetical protein
MPQSPMTTTIRPSSTHELLKPLRRDEIAIVAAAAAKRIRAWWDANEHVGDGSEER